MLLYWFLRLAAVALRFLPVRMSYAIARAAGTAAYYVWRNGRRRCVANMLRVTGGNPALARRYARRSFANYAAYVVDFIRLINVTRADIDERIDFDGWDLIESFRRGRGTVIVTVHFGVWDLGAAALARHDIPVTTVADTFAHPKVNALLVGGREQLGMRVLPAGRPGPGILRALHRNDVVAALIDVPHSDGVRAQFFGATIAVPDGPARIALSSGAEVIAAIMPRLSPWADTCGVDFEHVQYVATGDRERDVRGLTQAILGALERMIRQHPEQWYIFRSLWVDDLRAAMVEPVPA